MGRKRKKSKYGTEENEKLIKARHNSIPSYNEQRIINFFNDENIKVIREVTFPDLIGKTGYSLFFDFYVEQFDLLIEFDGKHHYMKDSAKYQRIKLNDTKKTGYAYKKGYKFLRIPYWKDPIVEIIQYLDRHFPVNGTNKIKCFLG